MKIAKQRLADNFCCAKCRGKIAVVETVIMQSPNIWGVLSGKFSPAFYAATCTLCGYTELYNARVYAMQFEESPDPDTVPQKS